MSAAIALLVLAATGCGSGSAQDGQDESSSGQQGRSDLIAYVEKADLVGRTDVALEPLQGGLLEAGEPLRLFVRLDGAAGVAPVPVEDLVRWSDSVPRRGGEGAIGLAAVCGQRWDEDGRLRSGDPCVAATPVTELVPDRQMLLLMTVYAATEDGRAVPGTYRTEVPLDVSAGLSLMLDVRVETTDSIPDWPHDRAEVQLTMEELPNDIDEPEIVLTDGYDRELPGAAQADKRARRPRTVEVPTGIAWRPSVRYTEDGQLRACPSAQVLVGDADRAATAAPLPLLVGDCVAVR